MKVELEGETIASLADARKLLEKFTLCGMNGIRRMYRGHSDASWELECSLNRYKGKLSEKELFDRGEKAYQDFKEFALQQDWQKFKPDFMHEDFFYLSMGRHLGLVCNLLDWTAGLEVAVEFAAQENPEKDGCVYALIGKYEILKDPLRCSPFDFAHLPKNTAIKDFDLIPDGESISDFPLARKRRILQNGWFTISKPEMVDFEQNKFLETNLVKWTVPARAKSGLMDEILQARKEKDWYLLESGMDSEAQQVVREINEKYFGSK